MARPQCDTPLVIQALELSLEYMNLEATNTYNFVFVFSFAFSPTPNTFETADLISSDLHEREREREILLW
jgi:hypothetical protein